MENNNKIFNVTNFLLVILIVIFLGNYFKKETVQPPAEITVMIPEVSGKSGIQTIETIREVPVVSREKEIIVDEAYYTKYMIAKDSIEKLNLYVEAIEVKEYNKTLIDNDTIKVDVFSKTRGSLLAQEVSYLIKSKPFSYKQEYIKVRPKLTLLPTVEVGLNRNTLSPIFKGGIGAQVKNGNIFSASVDSKENIYVGYSKSFDIIK